MNQLGPFIRRHRGFACMLPVGVVSAGLLLLWLGFGPALWDCDGWFLFSMGDLVDRRSLHSLPLNVPLSDGGWVFWFFAWTIVPGVTGFAWYKLRAEEIGLARDVAQAERLTERRDTRKEADGLWARAEAHEAEGDFEEQARLLEEYSKLARVLEVTANLRESRVQQIRTVARRLQHLDPDSSLRLLKVAQELQQQADTSATDLWSHVRYDVLGWVTGAAVVFGVVPLILLVVLGALGLVMSLFSSILTIVGLIVVVGILLSIFGS